MFALVVCRKVRQLKRSSAKQLGKRETTRALIKTGELNEHSGVKPVAANAGSHACYCLKPKRKRESHDTFESSDDSIYINCFSSIKRKVE